jgi:hypothetical protein
MAEPAGSGATSNSRGMHSVASGGCRAEHEAGRHAAGRTWSMRRMRSLAGADTWGQGFVSKSKSTAGEFIQQGIDLVG